jgi:cytochrome P450/NADPH-cytochrome P450 reductase
MLVGNLLDVAGATPLQNMMRLARQYGPIFQLDIAGRATVVVVSSCSLVDELCDDQRFDKSLGAGLRHVRAFAGDGLFTSWTYEPNWHKAHTVLLPTFSMQAMRGYLPLMVDIATQLIQKWERTNPEDEIDVPADMTRLTLDTIGLCGFGYRFNSFYREEPHPFVASMVRALEEALQQTSRLPVQNRLMVRKHRQFQDDISFMNSVVDTIIQERRAAGPDAAATRDLLGYMLTGVDKQSGERLDDLNIRYQIITFLIAGHETTSGLLSFALYFLLKHPAILARAYDEVDRVLGADLTTPPTYAQVQQLTYCSQILKEALRLWPPAPGFTRYPYQPTVLGGKYQLDKGQTVMVLSPWLHRDPTVWGENAEEFDPEHFSPAAEQSRPANAYKPFGTGQRACIGRQFALQEATLVLGMLLQRFELIDHTNYQLKIKETLTLKPADFRIKVRPRTSRAVVTPAPQVAFPDVEPAPAPTPVAVQQGNPLLVLYGSNLGTAEGLAQQIAEDGTARGLAGRVAPLDAYTGKLPQEGAVVVVAASYNGTPPDNAVTFCDWVRDGALTPDALQGVTYTVFGCGNRDWAATYQAVPTLIDRQLEAHGARRFYPRGEGDARADFESQFRAWYGPLWDALASALSLAPQAVEPLTQGHRYEVDVVAVQPASPVAAAYGARVLTIRENRELQRQSGPHPSERSTRHIEVALSEGMSYHAGDHLMVLPCNSAELVRRVAARFDLPPGALIRIRSNTSSKTLLPLDHPVTVSELLTHYVEVQEVAGRAQIQVLAEYSDAPVDKEKLLRLAGDDEESLARYQAEVVAPHKSLLDLLEEVPSCRLPFNIYLELLPPLRPCYYSISSSPLMEAHACSITVAVVDAPARSGQGRYRGVCSTYLAQQPAGSAISAVVRPPSTPFRPPDDPRVGMILVGAGTGLAPFRGFLQERAALKAQGQAIGPSLLFFGCRHPQQDHIYQEELEAFAQQGVTTLSCAFSRLDGQPKCYVQQKIAECRDEVWQLLQEGAIVYVCGDARKMEPDVRSAFATIHQEKTGGNAQDAEAWLDELIATHRYVADVWPS